jgi:UTP--glucose-1-phosphate uridylyltransferase
MNIRPIRKAVFPVAGLGTRFLPATKVMPKEMLTLLDRPLIQHAIDEAKDAGIEEFILVISRGKEILVDHFNSAPELEDILQRRGKKDALEKVYTSTLDDGALQTALQTEALGLGHAVWCARSLVGDEPFAVLLPDDVILSETGCLTQMVEAYNKTGGNVIAVENVAPHLVSNYGIIDGNRIDDTHITIKSLVEKPSPDKAPSTLAIIGRYILQPEIFTELARKEKGLGGEIQLTDAMARLLETQDFTGLRFHGTRYDCGSKLGFITANLAYALQDPEIQDDVITIAKNLIGNEYDRRQ